MAGEKSSSPADIEPPDAAEMPTIYSLDELAELVQGRDTIYLRYSHGPERDRGSGPSRDFEADVALPGWSVTTVAPEEWWPRPTREWVARRLCKYADLGAQNDSRFPWLLTGRVVGRGPDHEPLVTDFVPIAKIAESVVEEGLRVYRRSFAIGRDSTGDPPED
ncbi:DUF6098 family protein [Nocardia xishanensis]|uniref:DUF6098 family protein n=1 Tax=Nocardia xishanensis TaxID=238964 RepID=A0ABW7WWR2_9NOCA